MSNEKEKEIVLHRMDKLISDVKEFVSDPDTFPKKYFIENFSTYLLRFLNEIREDIKIL